jgi:hypothetical protein
MRARIIFRGLILFRFEEPGEEKLDNLRNRGKLTAWLVSDPKHANPSAMAMDAQPAVNVHDDPGSEMEGRGRLHTHVPRIGIYGRQVHGPEFKEVGIALASRNTTFELKGHDHTPDNVFTTPGFDRYVPNLSTLRPDARGAAKEDFAVSRIILPHGTLRARDLVSWDSDANQPAEVAFMGTKYRGFVANEAVLDVGDDSDYGVDDPSKYLSVEGDTPGIPKQLWPLTKRTKYVDETDPNTVEILITNFAAQRRRSVFWSLHYQALFAAAGFDPNRGYKTSEQFTNFVAAANDFDPTEWTDDFNDIDIGQPFPYIIPESISSLPAVRKDNEVVIHEGPADIGVRTKEDGVLVLSDPWARPICPLGQDDGLGGA